MAFESFTFQSNIVEKFYVGENLKKQGKCSFTLTRDGFLFFYASYTLPKNSPYTDWFSRGFVVVALLIGHLTGPFYLTGSSVYTKRASPSYGSRGLCKTRPVA